MSRFAKLADNAFKKVQMNAGILARSFNTTTGAVSGIIGVTSGGIAFNAAYTYKDFGEDMDNVPKNTKQLKRIESVEAKASGTFATIDLTSGKLMVGAADVSGTKITPRSDLSDNDFADLWLIGDYSDETSDTRGGWLAIHMMNSLSTGGFQLQTTDKDKGKFAFEFTAHYDYNSPSAIPFEIYIAQGTANGLLNLFSEAGSQLGQTYVSVVGYTLGEGESLKYKAEQTMSTLPAIGATISTGYTAMESNPCSITTTFGYYITVVVLDSSNKVVARNRVRAIVYED